MLVPLFSLLRGKVREERGERGGRERKGEREREKREREERGERERETERILILSTVRIFLISFHFISFHFISFHFIHAILFYFTDIRSCIRCSKNLRQQAMKLFPEMLLFIWYVIPSPSFSLFPYLLLPPSLLLSNILISTN
jgi:hypothetical protein